MKKVKTLQLDNKLLILNGQDPLRYVDLTTNKVYQYKEPKFRFLYKYLPWRRK